MSNKINYEITFQYDYEEDGPKKISDVRIKRFMAGHEGVFVSEFSDYGIKDLSFTINSRIDSVKTIMETVLKDAQRADVRMSVFAKKQIDLIIFNISDIDNKEEFFEKLNENQGIILYRKLNISNHDNNEISLELDSNIDKNNALNIAKSILEPLKVKNIDLTTDSIETLKLDNYKNKKRSSLDY